MEPSNEQVDENGSLQDSEDNTTTSFSTNEIQVHAVSALTRMNELRKRNQLCDVIVKVGDSNFPAHRVVLAASSDYFEAMFNSGMSESAQSSVELKGISGDVMESLLEFMYTGHVRVSLQNVQELLPAASLIQMEGVRTACCSFLYKEVEPSNVLGIRRFAELHNCLDLESFARNYAAHNFEMVVQTEEFFMLPAEELGNFLSREDLHVDNEETVYQAVMRWVHFDTAVRKSHLPDLLKHIRLAVMSARFLTDSVDNEPLIRQSLACRDLVDDAKRFHLRPDLRYEMKDVRFRARNGADEYLVMIGGFGADQAPSDSVEMFNPRTHEWTDLPSLPFRYRYVAACSLGTCIYVLGGFDGRERLNTVGVLDITKKDDGWKWLASMHFKRGLAAACTHKGLIYMCGGFDGQNRLRSLEVYHPKIDEWRLLEEMATPREGAGLVLADDMLYCMGGYDGSQLLKCVEKYDPRRGVWQNCESMQCRRSGAGCAVLGDTIYVCGGYGGVERNVPLHLDTVECYNTRLDEWSLVVPMNVPRCYVGACHMRGKIFVAAGYDGSRLLDTVESYDPLENCWVLQDKSRMKHQRCDTGTCVVKFLEFAEPTVAGLQQAFSTTVEPPSVTLNEQMALLPISHSTSAVANLILNTSDGLNNHSYVNQREEGRGGPQNRGNQSTGPPGGVSGPVMASHLPPSSHIQLVSSSTLPSSSELPPHHGAHNVNYVGQLAASSRYPTVSVRSGEYRPYVNIQEPIVVVSAYPYPASPLRSSSGRRSTISAGRPSSAESLVVHPPGQIDDLANDLASTSILGAAPRNFDVGFPANVDNSSNQVEVAESLDSNSDIPDDDIDDPSDNFSTM